MIRTTYGVTARTRVSVGRIKATGCSHGRPPGGIRVMAGRMCNTVVEKRTTRATPTTNSGSAAKTRVTNEVATSKGRSRHRAAEETIRIESGIEISPEHT